MVPDAAETAGLLRAQLRHVRGRSPLYERLLAGLAGAAERGFDGGVIGRLLHARGPRDEREAVLLLLAALHHTALEDPSLPHAAWFPTAADRPRSPSEGAPGALALAYLVEHEEAANAFVSGHRLQTNDAGRCLGLLPGILAAAQLGRPLRLVELGCSAGLNLRADRYHYRYHSGPSWGPRSGPVLEAAAEGSVPDSLVPPTVEVVDRVGVDLHPIDPSSAAGARLLTAFIWPDERERHARLQAATDLAAATPVDLREADLADFVERDLDTESGVTTIVFHSLVAHLLTPETSNRLAVATERWLRSAGSDDPAVHLRLEPPVGLDTPPELVITISDGSGPPRSRTLVTADWHGRWVRWW